MLQHNSASNLFKNFMILPLIIAIINSFVYISIFYLTRLRYASVNTFIFSLASYLKIIVPFILLYNFSDIS